MTNESITYWRVTATSTISTYEIPIMAYMSANCIVGKQYTISCDERIPTTGDVSFINNTGKNTGIPANVMGKVAYRIVEILNL